MTTPAATIVYVWAAVLVLACTRRDAIDYETADPVADARAALATGKFHLLAVRTGDSVVSPIDPPFDTMSINVEVGPDGGIRYLDVVADRATPGVPGWAKIEYVKRFNSEMFRMILENMRPPRLPSRLPPNPRLELAGASK